MRLILALPGVAQTARSPASSETCPSRAAKSRRPRHLEQRSHRSDMCMLPNRLTRRCSSPVFAPTFPHFPPKLPQRTLWQSPASPNPRRQCRAVKPAAGKRSGSPVSRSV
eukprot:364812-Chlamydomonas_euryale.AAC.4